MIAVIDYKMGNLRSVEKALQVVGGRTKVTARASDIARAEKVVFPGVGSFGEAMAELKRLKLVAPLTAAIASGKPFLGLCLGMQLLFETSEEAPGVKGLGILPGTVKRFSFRDKALKVPHMGWNTIRFGHFSEMSNHPGPMALDKGQGSRLLSGVPDGSYMYFVHSYYVKPKDKKVALTTTEYGTDFVSGVSSGMVFGLQFHPEKSQASGLKILKNFVRM